VGIALRVGQDVRQTPRLFTTPFTLDDARSAADVFLRVLQVAMQMAPTRAANVALLPHLPPVPTDRHRIKEGKPIVIRK
jgi:hypothetical protein